MATSTKSLERTADGDDPAVEQDRRKFKPFRAIKRIFKGKKKSKGLSQSMGSVLTPNYDDSPSAANLARSISHESVFAKDGVATGFSENAKIRTVLSVGDVTEVPIDRLKDNTAAEGVTSTTSMSKVISVDQKFTSDEKSPAEVKTDNVFGNMNDLPTDVTRLSNKLAYDKIAVRPKRRPAKNARGARQAHIIRVEETPTAVNGFDGDEITDEIQERKLRDTSPGPSATKPILPGLQISSVTEDSTASDTPKRPLRKSPIGAVPTGFVPSLQDVQAFKNRSKRIEESIEPTAPKPTKTVAAPVVVAKTDTVEKPKKSPKAGKKAQKKSGESSSSVFSWKNKIKSPASPRKTKSSDSPKDETRSKGLFSGLMSKKSSDKDSKSSSTVGSKLFFQGDKKEQTKKKGAGNEPTKEKKDIEDAIQNSKKKITEDNKQDDITDTKAKVTAQVEVTTTVEKPTQAEFSPPFQSRIRPSGAMGLFDEINSEMARKMKSKALSPVEKQDNVPKFQDVLKSMKKDTAEKEEVLTVKNEDIGAVSTAVSQSESSPSQIVESKSISDSVSVSETPPTVQNKPVPIARIKNKGASKSQSDEHVDKEGTSTHPAQGQNAEISNVESATEDAVTSSSIVENSEVVNTESDIDQPVTTDSVIVSDESVSVEKDISAEMSPMKSSEKTESVNTDADCNNMENVLQEDLTTQTSTHDTPDRVVSMEVDGPDIESVTNLSENSSTTNVEGTVKIQTAEDSLRTVSNSSIEEDLITSEIKEDVEVTSSIVEIPSKVNTLDKSENKNAPTDMVEDKRAKTEDSVKPNSLVENNTDLAKPVLLSPSTIENNQSATDLFSQVKLKPVSRNAANRKSASVKISPGDPAPKPLRPHSWNTKDNAADSKIGEKSENMPVKVEATSTRQTSPVKKPRLALKPKSPVKSPDKLSFSKSPEEQSRVKSPTKQFSTQYSSKPPAPASSDKPQLLKSPDKQSPMKFVKPPPIVSPNEPVANPVKQPLLKSPNKQPAVKFTEAENNNNNVLVMEAEAKPVPRISTSQVKPPSVRSPDRQPSAKAVNQGSENVFKIAKAEVKSAPRRTKTPVESPEKQPSTKPTDQDSENNNVFEAPEEDAKPVLRRSSERKKREDQEKDGGSEPAWIKIARRRSKHWEDGATRPKSSSTPTPTAPGSDSARPQTLSAAPKRRSLSSSKAELPSLKNTPVSPTRNIQSNRTSCIPAINPNPTDKSSPTAKQTPISAQGKPSWLAIAMQKQKSWGAKEEMV